MKSKFLALLFFIIFTINCAQAQYDEISNRYFSIFMPVKLKDFYSAEIKKDSVMIYHNDSKEKGFGGFVFGYKVYKNPKHHAMMPGSRKVGELQTVFKVKYDMVLIQPTDVQYDYTKKEPKSYKELYDLAQNIEIKPKGKSTFDKNQGTKGELLYKKVLNKHISAIEKKWDSKKLEKNNMSYMYNVLSKTNDNVLDKIGYTFYDTNADGIDELLIGEIADGEWKGVIYDIYTMVNRKPRHVVSGGTRDRYYICDDVFICREYLQGAKEHGWLIYILLENSTELFPQLGFKYDGYKNEKSPWFITYDIENDSSWENVSKKAYDKRKKVFNKYERFNYIPLSKFERK